MLKKTVKQLLRYGYDAPPPRLTILYEGTKVAELSKENNQYTFRYLDAFQQMGLQPLPGLPIGSVYGPSPELPLYFRERLPDPRRPDVRQLLKQFHIPEGDLLLLLATLGKHTVTDPFEFQLTAA
jgi:HipA-like protein